MATKKNGSKKNGAVTVTMTQNKETKNTFRYEEVVKGYDSPKIGTLYLPKSTCQGAEQIEVSVTLK